MRQRARDFRQGSVANVLARARFPHGALAIAATTLCFLGSLGTARGLAAPRPNVVIILADDLGYGELSSYGSKRAATPHLDQLASEGLRFTDFHSSGAVCSPTRAGLLTGRYQQRAGIPGVINADPKLNRHHGLSPNATTTFAEILQHAGYATAIFGKWHLGYDERFHPRHHGFDHFRGYVSGNIDYQSHYDRMGVHDWWHDGERVTEKGYVTRLITKHAIEFIEEHRDRPFLAYIAHEAPHVPFQGPDDEAFRTEGKVVPERTTKAQRERAYREMIEELDRSAGEIADTIDRLGLGERTLILFASDNGATAFGDNGRLRGTKGTLWEGGHRVPAIARWTGKITPGRVSEATAITIDIFPTLLAVTGAMSPEHHTARLDLDGIDLSPILFGEGELPRRKLYWAYGRQRAVRDGPWKLVADARGEEQETPELFRLDEDVAETKDLAAAYPGTARKLRAALAAWEAEVARGAVKQPPPPSDGTDVKGGMGRGERPEGAEEPEAPRPKASAPRV